MKSKGKKSLASDSLYESKIAKGETSFRAPSLYKLEVFGSAIPNLIRQIKRSK